MIGKVIGFRFYSDGKYVVPICNFYRGKISFRAFEKMHLVKAIVFPVVMYGCESWTIKKAERWRIDAFELWSWRRLLRVLNIHWKDWCWSWSSNTLATWCKEPSRWKRPWCWERSKVGGEGDNRGWNGWMAPPIRWTRVWVSSESWSWTGKPGVLQSMGSQRAGRDWTEEIMR